MNELNIFFVEIQPLLFQKKYIKRNIKKLINNELKKMGEISVIFCSDNYLLSINKQFLKHDYYTDIVTFNYVENDMISGDLYISVDRVKENAEMFKTGFYNELFRVIFHGILHLIGYNDKTEKEKIIMREKENKYLSEVEFKGMKI